MNQQMDKPKSNGGAVEVVMNAFSEYKNANDKNLEQRDNALNSKIEELYSQTDRIEELLNRPFGTVPKPEASQPNRFAITVAGKKIPVLAREDSLASYFRPQSSNGEQEWNLQDFVRNSMGLSNIKNSVVERGSANAPEFLSSQIVDAVRAKSTLINSGALTLPIDGATIIARIDTDAVCHSHVEGIDDIDESLPVFTPIELNPNMLSVQIPLSAEVAEDSANLNLLLKTSIAAAIAKKIDQLGIAALLADSAIEESAVSQDTETWAGLLQAAGSSIALDNEWPKTVISNASDYAKRISQVSGDGQWLVNPPPLATMKDLFSTHMTAGKALMGDFERSVLLAIRSELRIEIVRWHRPGSASHLMIAYMRGAFYTVQPGSLYRQLKTVV
ncbi:phage major capsid protein, HK97 family [Nitrosomonas ureae]|uniref:Phage major capsid protein, HK97 family n=3 Tax=Nitrosomonas ureae TaxID=44577 RepID=A0A1H2HK82_9PROT|nr:phage major capsid protein, HK97 family [Nitrosomonas ureae]